MTTPSTGTVVLIHGLWMTPFAWEHWVGRYEARGFTSVPPQMLKTPAKPGGLPVATFDATREGLKHDQDFTLRVYPDAPHGLADTPAYQGAFNTDLLNFLKA